MNLDENLDEEEKRMMKKITTISKINQIIRKNRQRKEDKRGNVYDSGMNVKMKQNQMKLGRS